MLCPLEYAHCLTCKGQAVRFSALTCCNPGLVFRADMHEAWVNDPLHQLTAMPSLFIR